MRAWIAVLLLVSSVARAEGWVLSQAQLASLGQGEVVVTGSVGGEIRAAVQIQAPAEEIFAVMTDCERALEYVPHLEHCAVLETAEDGSWQIIEHRVDRGWFVPGVHYVFRAEYEPFTEIRFAHVRGDLRENEGVWHLQPAQDGNATIVTYQVRVVPRFFVPRWIMRGALRRDLPTMLRRLRAQCEQVVNGQSH